MNNILFIHQNFPGQFRYLAPALARNKKNKVVAMNLNGVNVPEWNGVTIVKGKWGQANNASNFLKCLQSILGGEW